jgi:hypothetical protein
VPQRYPSGPNLVLHPEWRPVVYGPPVTIGILPERAVSPAFAWYRTIRTSGTVDVYRFRLTSGGLPGSYWGPTLS